MKRLQQLSLTAAMLVAASPGLAAERQVKITDLPPAVQETVKKETGTATVRGVSKEVEHGKTLYEVALRAPGHNRDVSIDPSGAVVSVEEDVTLEAVPTPARAAIETTARGGTIRRIESTMKDGTIVAYEATVVKPDRTRVEVRVRPDGSPAPE